VTARLRKLGTEIRDQGVGVTAAGVEVAAMRGEGAGAEVTIAMTGEAEVEAMNDGGAIAATVTIEDQATAVNCQTGGEVRLRGQGHARGVEDLFNETQRTNLLWPLVFEHAAALPTMVSLTHDHPASCMFKYTAARYPDFYQLQFEQLARVETCFNIQSSIPQACSPD
jgi:hypothetical protein